MNRQQAIAELCAPGQPYELKATQIGNRSCRVFVNAPATLPELYADNRSDRCFIVYDQQRLSFDEVYLQASALAKAMVEDYGIQPGDRVAIAMRNYPEWVVSFFATTAIGAIAVSINPLWNTKELAGALQDCRPALITVDQERLYKLAGCESLATGLDVIRVRAEPLQAIASDNWGDIIHRHLGYPMPDVAVNPDDDATIIYTSGSTGAPKGAISTHRNLIHALLSWELDTQLRIHMGLYQPPEQDHQEAFLLAVPLFHVSGSHVAMLASLRSQRKMVCMYKWDAQQGMALIERERITVFTATSTITGDLVQAARSSTRDLSSLKMMGGGGAARAPEQVRAIQQVTASNTVSPQTGWGMTETNAIGTGFAGTCYLQHPTSSGQCSAVLDIRIVDETGKALPNGERGELQIRGTSMFRGYWNRPDAEAEAFDGEWFRTGDAAVIDDEGYLYIVDRLKELVIRGGENIGCGTVEAALLEHPDIIEACVYGLPDQRMGEEVGVTIYVESPLSEEQLRDFLAERLAKYEVPRYIHQCRDALPRVASGKLFRQQLRQEAVARLGLSTTATA